MAKSWDNTISKENFKDFKDNARFRAPWERDAVRLEDFRYGSHFSKAEEMELLKYRQAPIPVGLVSAICESAEAATLSTKYMVKVAPIINPYDDNSTARSKRVAAIYNHLISKSWYDSLGSLQYDRVLTDASNVGHGLFYIIPRNEFGEFTVDIKRLNWRYFYPHPLTKSPFYDDADNMIIAMNLSEKAAYRFVKSIEPDITFEKFKEEFIKGSEKVNVNLRQRYVPSSINDGPLFIQKLVLEDQFLYVVIPVKDEINRENSDVGYKVYSELTPELIKLEKEGKIRLEKKRKFVLTEYTSIGNYGYKVVYPIDTYNIVAHVYDHRDSPYPLGRVWYLYPLQRAFNKFVMLAVINGALMNSFRVIAEEDSITDFDEFKKNFSSIGAILKWKQKVPGYSQPPQIMEGKPLSDAWLAFPKYLAYLMEYVSGIFGVMMGDSRESPEVFSTVASLQSAGGLKVRRRQSHAVATLSRVGYVAGLFYKEYAPLNAYSVTMNNDGELEEPVYYNRLIINEQTNKVDIDPDTDLSVGFKEVRFTAEAASGYEAGTEAALLTTLATQLKIPQVIPLILKRLNIPDVDKIVSQIDLVTQQGATIDQMKNIITELERRVEIMANQIQQKSYETETAKFRAELDKIINKLKAEINNNGQ